MASAGAVSSHVTCVQQAKEAAEAAQTLAEQKISEIDDVHRRTNQEMQVKDALCKDMQDKV